MILEHLASTAFWYAFELWVLAAGVVVGVSCGWLRRRYRILRRQRAAQRYEREHPWSAAEQEWLDFERHHR